MYIPAQQAKDDTQMAKSSVDIYTIHIKHFRAPGDLLQQR